MFPAKLPALRDGGTVSVFVWGSLRDENGFLVCYFLQVAN